MFAKTIIDSDAFLDMPLSTQALYFHLSMRADDDGFLNNPLKILRMVGGNQNDYDLLKAKNFIITFENGVIVIKHWKMHNYLRADRYKETVYLEEKSKLTLKENGAYSLNDDFGIPTVNQVVYQLDTQVRLGKDSVGKDSIYRQIQHLPFSNSDNEQLKVEGWTQCQIDDILDRMENYGKLKTYKSAILTARKWLKKDYPLNSKFVDDNPFVSR